VLRSGGVISEEEWVEGGGSCCMMVRDCGEGS